MHNRSPLPRGGVIHWRGQSGGAKFSPRRVDGNQLLQIEKFIGHCLVGFLEAHPCIGARQLGADRSFHYAVYKDLTSVEVAYQFLRDVNEYYMISDTEDEILKTLLCVFTDYIGSQEEFSKKFWSFVQLAHDLDSLTHSYDAAVASDPQAADFELSFRGRAVFPTTFHPCHSRVARKFAYAGWALNQSSQFGALRTQGKFENWQGKIRRADSSFDPSGKPNPLLADHGTASAAAQLGELESGEYPFIRRQPQERELVINNLLGRAQTEGAGPEVVEYLKRCRDFKATSE